MLPTKQTKQPLEEAERIGGTTSRLDQCGEALRPAAHLGSPSLP
jgi:hypothetical protein